MANIGGPQSSTENAIKMAASTSTSAASSRGIYWPDRVMTLLLEAVREKESLWNTKSEAYKNRNVKKVQYEDVLQLIKEELPDVNFVPRLYLSKVITGALNFKLLTIICCAIYTIKYICLIKIVT